MESLKSVNWPILTVQQDILIQALKNTESYDEKVDDIRLVQTHISYVFLTGKYAYKIKKPVDFGFLDFTTLRKRRYYCYEELRLNRRLCGDMYIAVLPITVRSGAVKISGDGRIVEYTLKMREMPQDALMSKMLSENRVAVSHIEEMASILSAFHRSAETNNEIRRYGSLSTITYNWVENFEQTRDFIGKTISEYEYTLIRERVDWFLRNRRHLFRMRMKTSKIRECHGDLHSGNIFIADKIYIYDAIEFNRRFRCSDTASDIAFLLMDLEFKGKDKLANVFLDRYLELSGESQDFLDVLPFYKCYRAYVRGKVTSFKLADPHIPDQEKEEARDTAKRYFDLSLEYANLMR
ncbi:MAG: hypothetical protein RMJ07_05150 [Nitrososphaerota archaeon]|nr:hypothetical protein [Candidatus Bathyarchaeota archaeon]MDW8049051.1 hypothetical protein [Nitrososphaerota archaeon]